MYLILFLFPKENGQKTLEFSCFFIEKKGKKLNKINKRKKELNKEGENKVKKERNRTFIIFLKGEKLPFFEKEKKR